MPTLILSLLLCLLLFGATWLGGHRAAAAGGVEPTRADLRQGIHQTRGRADLLRRNRCLPARSWPTVAGYRWRSELAKKLRWAQTHKRVVKNGGWRPCWGWYRTSGFSCIRRHEGAWNDPNGPYWGGVQADMSFQRAYGGNWLRRFGTADRWRARYQVNMAWRGYHARGGFGPWPTTSVYCGLR